MLSMRLNMGGVGGAREDIEKSENIGIKSHALVPLLNLNRVS
jgi:hypothetical protein